MELIFEWIAWFALFLGCIFILWKLYLFTTWNIERTVFLGGIGAYLGSKSKNARKKQAVAAK